MSFIHEHRKQRKKYTGTRNFPKNDLNNNLKSRRNFAKYTDYKENIDFFDKSYSFLAPWFEDDTTQFSSNELKNYSKFNIDKKVDNDIKKTTPNFLLKFIFWLIDFVKRLFKKITPIVAKQVNKLVIVCKELLKTLMFVLQRTFIESG